MTSNLYINICYSYIFLKKVYILLAENMLYFAYPLILI